MLNELWTIKNYTDYDSLLRGRTGLCAKELELQQYW